MPSPFLKLTILACSFAVTVGAVAEAAGPVDMEKAGATKFTLSGDWLASGGGSIWLSDPPAKVMRQINPSTGTEVSIAVGQAPCESPDFAYGALWTATCNPTGLARLDAATHKETGFVPLPIWSNLGGEGAIGAGSGGVWVVIDGPTCKNCLLARIDPKTMKVVVKISVSERSSSVRIGYGAVWVVSPAQGTVQKISPTSNKVTATATVGHHPRFFDVGEGGVWTLNQETGTVSHVNPSTAKLQATIQTQSPGWARGGDMAVGGGWVWVRRSDALLTRIDPKTNRVVQIYGPSSGSGSVVVGPGGVWVSAHDVKTVWRLPLPKR
jgi:streptogramin lyase